MKRGDLELTKFFKFLSSQKFVSCRALVYRNDNVWRVHTAYIVNAVPSMAPSGFFEYGEIGFLVKRISGRHLANALQLGKLSANKIEFELPELQATARHDRFPSHTARFWRENVFPFTLVHVSSREGDVRLNEFEPLISSGLPSFANLKMAVFFYLYETNLDRDISLNRELVFHINHKEAWIDKVYLEPSAISVEVKGRQAKKARLEVRVGGQHSEAVVKRPGRIKFPLRAGLKERIWIVLSRKDDWLDQREIDLRYRDHSNTKDKNLIIKSPDAQVELKGVIALGEGETTEFKLQVPDSRDSGRKFTRTVAAFANGSGGMIMVGVENGSGAVKGIIGDVNQEKVRLAQIIRNNLTHQPVYRIYDRMVDGLPLIIVEVTKGENRPYGIDPNDPRYYVRRGATTFPATPDEVQILSQKPQENALKLWPY